MMGKFERKGSFTFCRLCKGQIITLTEQDGTIIVTTLEQLQKGVGDG